MNRKPFLVVLALSLLAAPGCALKSPTPGTLEFERKVVDLGKVLQHHQYEVRYPYTVVGDGPVRFHTLEAAHGMTGVRVEPNNVLGEWIPLGTKGEIVVTFATGRYIQNMTSLLSVYGDFQSGREMLEVEMFIEPVFEMEPRVVQFGSLSKSELHAESHSQVVQVTGLKDFEIERWVRTPPGVTIQSLDGRNTIADGRVVRKFLVVPQPSLQVGRLSSSFIAETSLGVELEFMVNAEVIGQVRYAPSSRVAFGIFSQGEEKRRQVKIEAFEPNLRLPLPTVSVEGDAALVVQAEVRTVTEDRHYGITLNIGKHAPPGSYNGVLRITYPEASGVAPKEIMLNARIRSSR